MKSLKLINSYLTERKQMVKIIYQFSSLLDIVASVLQGSILRSLLFNTFLCDMFLLCNDIDFANYADDNTLHCIGKAPEKLQALARVSHYIDEGKRKILFNSYFILYLSLITVPSYR